MTYESPDSLLLVLAKGSGDSRLTVDLESFLRFNAQMDEDLKHLAERWADFSTPASLRGEGFDSDRIGQGGTGPV